VYEKYNERKQNGMENEMCFDSVVEHVAGKAGKLTLKKRNRME
jgi:hypothetical protein